MQERNQFLNDLAFATPDCYMFALSLCRVSGANLKGLMCISEIDDEMFELLVTTH